MQFAHSSHHTINSGQQVATMFLEHLEVFTKVLERYAEIT